MRLPQLTALQPGRAAVVIGAPGSERSREIVEIIGKIHADSPEASIMVMANSRLAATALDNQLLAYIGSRPPSLQVASLAACAYSILADFACAVGRAKPHLLTGAEQDVVLRSVLEALAADLPSCTPTFLIDDDGAPLPTLTSASFRAEMRDLLTRASELGLTAEQLREAGEACGESMWRFGAEVMELYRQSRTLSDATIEEHADILDHTALVTSATRMLDQWDELTTIYGRGKATPTPRPHYDWVIVEDAQNATFATIALLTTLARLGARVIVVGNPDEAVNGFRGGYAQFPLVAADALEAETYLLPARTPHPLSEALDWLCGHVTTQFSAARNDLARCAKEIRDKREKAGEQNGGEAQEGGAEAQPVAVHEYVTRDMEIAAIARMAKEWHVRDGVPYSQIAVITRSSSDHRDIAHGLRFREVPVIQPASAQVLWAHPAVRGLAHLIDDVTDARARILITSMYGMMSPEEMRTLLSVGRVYLRAHGCRTLDYGTLFSAEWRAEFPDFSANLPTAIADSYTAMANLWERGRALATQPARAALWELWQATGKERVWQDAALDPHDEDQAVAANERLDVLLQLFAAAARFDESQPQGTLADFFQSIAEQEIPLDSVAPRGRTRDAVELHTPWTSAGRSWQRVIIAGMVDGVWPNVRVRNAISRTPALVHYVITQGDQGFTPGVQLTEVIDDELRMFIHSLACARESAVITYSAGENLGSRFVPLLNVPVVKPIVIHDLTPDGIVGFVRKLLPSPDYGQRAAELMARLSDEDWSGTDPQTWLSTFDLTSDEPIYGEGAPITLSASSIESLIECPVRWFLDRLAMSDTSNRAPADLGTLVHGIAEEFTEAWVEFVAREKAGTSRSEGSPEAPTFQELTDQMLARLDERWPADCDRTSREGVGLYALYEDAVLKLRDYLYKNSGQPTRCEESLEFTVDGVTIRGRLDRIECHPGGDVVVDFKTGRAISEKDAEVNPQLAFYQYGWEAQGNPPTAGAQLAYIKTKNKTTPVRKQVALSEDDRQRIRDQIAQMREDLSRGHLRGCDQPTCRACSRLHQIWIDEGDNQ